MAIVGTKSRRMTAATTTVVWFFLLWQTLGAIDDADIATPTSSSSPLSIFSSLRPVLLPAPLIKHCHAFQSPVQQKILRPGSVIVGGNINGKKNNQGLLTMNRHPTDSRRYYYSGVAHAGDAGGKDNNNDSGAGSTGNHHGHNALQYAHQGRKTMMTTTMIRNMLGHKVRRFSSLAPRWMAISSGAQQDAGAAAEGGGNNDDTTTSNIAKGRALLCLVAFLYGSLNVSLRFLYDLPNPPTASALSAARGWLASLCFLPLMAANNKSRPNAGSSSTDDDSSGEASATAATVSKGKSSPMSFLFWAGFELAIWNFISQGLLNIGLLSTGSARASFLTQTSVIWTPIITLISGQSIPSGVWMGCGIALMGLTLLSGIGFGGGGGLLSSLAFSTGDYLVLGGALSWSFYMFRLSKIGNKFNEINLQATKTGVLSVLYSLWFAVSWMAAPAGTMMSSLGWVTHIVAWLAIFYSALGPGTMADVLQQVGQKDVSAAEANVILSMEPVFSAVCAHLLLGEITTTQESIGGSLIVLAALVTTLTGR